MARDEFSMGDGDRQLLDYVADLMRGEDQMPESVADAAKALYDWVRVDAELAQLVDSQVLTRSDETALTWQFGPTQLRVEVEPAGYRRRRVVVVAHDRESAEAASAVSVQFADGTSVPVTADKFGERITKVPAGSVRVVAVFASGAVMTPWFAV